MSSSERAAELRAMADQLEEISALEDNLERARDLHAANPFHEANKDAYTAAQETLRDARKKHRESSVMVSPAEAGSVAIRPQTTKGSS